ncbi:L-ascorbate oxidase [Tothia fuscella]|uniref:L-ascorbate oxidase n=1 Tax=Tothia fuscella TaxID=1048955 RepID=A0A9P4P3E2_9PEZI|nr:L-ascorbate oxidase [Tothia fuscella]
MKFSSSLTSLALTLTTQLINPTAASYHVHDGSWTPNYILRATAKNISVNCESRYSVVLNGTSPGPTLHLQEGQTTWIRVYNDIDNENLTVHWHGLSQRTAPFSDGTPQVSQWPIPPDNFFDYEVHPDIGDAGTYFYHSHVGFQSISAQGALIVEDCGKPAYTYDDEITLLLADYYNTTDAQISKKLLGSPFVWSGETTALLMNGQTGTAGLGNAADSSCAPLVIKVDPDTDYRIRFIGGTAISLVTLGIEDHNLTIVEADGADTKPFTTDHLQIAPGQRFSLSFRSMRSSQLASADKTSFWIRYENRERPANVSGYALLSYNVPNGGDLPQSLPDTSPMKLPAKVYDWLEYSLQPHESIQEVFPDKATRTVTIQMNQLGSYVNKTFTTTLEWEQNGLVWQENEISRPYLVDIYEKGQSAVPDYDAALANRGWDPANKVFPAKVSEVLDIVWQSNNLPTGGFDIHPMHAHGGHYWDLGSGNGTYDATENEERLKGYTPVKRDTTMLYRYASSGVLNTTAGWRAWRIKVDDTGLWMMHCHILQHMIMGMNTVWSFGDANEIAAKWPLPYVTGYLQYGGSAYGNETYDPLVNHYFADVKPDKKTCRPYGGYDHNKRYVN